ncbi:hypothetical protein [Rothia koreensis]|uniref:hypothetical protein n=1 Tax=Rothia koreensis TaxID=592378 RepID=UPI003FCCED3B
MGTKKTVGATTLSATGGSVVGGALAAIVLYFFPESARVELFAPLTIVLSAVCALAGGYLSPSRVGALAPYLAQASEDIADKVATKAPTAVVPSADEVAEAVANKTSTSYTLTGYSSDEAKVRSDAKADTTGYVGAHAASDGVERYRPTETPVATEPGVDVQAVAAPADTSDDAYPDLDSLAKL